MRAPDCAPCRTSLDLSGEDEKRPAITRPAFFGGACLLGGEDVADHGLDVGVADLLRGGRHRHGAEAARAAGAHLLFQFGGRTGIARIFGGYGFQRRTDCLLVYLLSTWWQVVQLCFFISAAPSSAKAGADNIRPAVSISACWAFMSNSFGWLTNRLQAFYSRIFFKVPAVFQQRSILVNKRRDVTMRAFHR